MYTPFYYYVGAAASKVIGVGFLPLRLISVAASVGSFLVVFFLIARETRDTAAAILGAALLAATYRITATYFDLARVDSLALFLLLASVYVMRFGRSTPAAILGGSLICLAFLAKQQTLAIGLPLAFYAALSDARRGSLLFITATGLVVMATYLLHLLSGGWFTYYTFVLPLQHELTPEVTRVIWWHDLLGPLPVANVLILWYLITKAAERDRQREVAPEN